MGRAASIIGLVLLTGLMLTGLEGCDLFYDERGGLGEPCFPGNEYCKSGLYCVDRTCQAEQPDGGEDAGDDGDAGSDPGADPGQEDGDPGADPGSDPDGDPEMDGDGFEENCEDLDGDGHYNLDPITCPSGDDYCDDVEDSHEHNWTETGCTSCEDEDGDGYGVNCDKGPDCNEGNPSVPPGCPTVYIFRSVEAGNENLLHMGQGAAIETISDSHFTFTAPLPNTVGVGDIIQYANDGTPNFNALAVIVNRDSETVVEVTDTEGAPVGNVPNPGFWKIFRAYTSLKNALEMQENPGIEIDRNFDDELTDKDLVSLNRVWNIACYAGGVDQASGTIDVTGWNSDDEYFLHIFTPYDLSMHVGQSQRHWGKWTPDPDAYILQRDCSLGGNILAIATATTVHIDGLQIHKTAQSDTPSCTAIEIMDSAKILLSNTIIRGTDTNGVGVFLNNSDAMLKMWNNVIYNTAVDDGAGIQLGDDVNACIYNNTIYNCYRGVYSEYPSNTGVVLKNNLSVANNADRDFDTTTEYSANSTNNCSMDATASQISGSGGPIGCQPTGFVNADIGNFHLTDIAHARDKGADLGSDPCHYFGFDIDRHSRPENDIWDIGADEYNVANP